MLLKGRWNFGKGDASATSEMGKNIRGALRQKFYHDRVAGHRTAPLWQEYVEHASKAVGCWAVFEGEEGRNEEIQIARAVGLKAKSTGQADDIAVPTSQRKCTAVPSADTGRRRRQAPHPEQTVLALDQKRVLTEIPRHHRVFPIHHVQTVWQVSWHLRVALDPVQYLALIW